MTQPGSREGGAGLEQRCVQTSHKEEMHALKLVSQEESEQRSLGPPTLRATEVCHISMPSQVTEKKNGDVYPQEEM